MACHGTIETAPHLGSNIQQSVRNLFTFHSSISTFGCHLEIEHILFIPFYTFFMVQHFHRNCASPSTTMTSSFVMTSCRPPPSQRGLALDRRPPPRLRPQRWSAAANGATARRRPRWPGASGWRTENAKVPWVKLGKLPTLWQLKDPACILKRLS